MALQHSFQPQTNGDYWCCFHDRQRGIKKVSENVAKINLTWLSVQAWSETKTGGHCRWVHAHLGQIQEFKTLFCILWCLVFQPVHCCSPAAGLKGIPNSLLMPICGSLDHRAQPVAWKKLNTGRLTTNQLLTLGWITWGALCLNPGKSEKEVPNSTRPFPNVFQKIFLMCHSPVSGERALCVWWVLLSLESCVTTTSNKVINCFQEWRRYCFTGATRAEQWAWWAGECQEWGSVGHREGMVSKEGWLEMKSLLKYLWVWDLASWAWDSCTLTAEPRVY